jgi:hypothetical protein
MGEVSQAVQRKTRNITLTSGLEKLHDGPNGNVLKRGIGATQKSMEILVHAPFRLFPYIIKCRVVVGSCATI